MANEQLFGLTQEQAKRIGKLVQGNERQTPPQLRQQSGTSTPDRALWMEVTGGSIGAYDWKLMYPDATGDLIAASPAVTGSGLYDANGAELEVGQRVEAKFAGFDASGQPLYVCAASTASLPTGQYQYMVYQMTASNVAGWDFARAHP